MTLEVKKSTNMINYIDAINLLEKKVVDINKGKCNELVWILEHKPIFTAGTSHKNSEIIDKSINIIKTSRGGKITWHGPGQLICYFALDLNKRGKDIRKFINTIENTIIETLKFYNIQSFSDKKNIGIWVNYENEKKKVAAIGIKVKKWIAYHGFSININNSLEEYKKINPCGLDNKNITTLKKIKNQNYNNISDEVLKNFFKNFKN